MTRDGAPECVVDGEAELAREADGASGEVGFLGEMKVWVIEGTDDFAI